MTLPVTHFVYLCTYGFASCNDHNCHCEGHRPVAIRVPIPCCDSADVAKGERIATPACALVRDDMAVVTLTHLTICCICQPATEGSLTLPYITRCVRYFPQMFPSPFIATLPLGFCRFLWDNYHVHKTTMKVSK